MILPDLSPAATAAAEEQVTALEAQSRLQWSDHAHGRIAWRSWGEGPPYLLIHGNYGSWTHWVKSIPALLQHYRVVVPDLPGFGRSDPPPFDSTPADIALLLQSGLPAAIGQEESLRVAGFSMGCRFAGVMAVALSERIERVVLFGPGGLQLPVPTLPSLGRLAPGMDREERMAVHTHNLAKLMLAGMEEVDTLAVVLQEQNVSATRYRPAFRRREQSLHEVLRQVSVPLVGAWGSQDPYVGEFMEERRRYIEALPGPASFRLIDGAAHWSVYQCATVCNALLLED